MSTKQVQEAYIVAATRTPIGKSGRGYFKNTRPDDLLVAAIQAALKSVPSLDPKAIEDAIVGCSFPEGEQGMNVARVGALLAGLPARWAASRSTASAPRASPRCRWRPTASASARPT
jgi:acetyl-CoA acyltransferase